MLHNNSTKSTIISLHFVNTCRCGCWLTTNSVFLRTYLTIQFWRLSVLLNTYNTTEMLTKSSRISTGLKSPDRLNISLIFIMVLAPWRYEWSRRYCWIWFKRWSTHCSFPSQTISSSFLMASLLSRYKSSRWDSTSTKLIWPKTFQTNTKN